jgi:hypothetical protein
MDIYAALSKAPRALADGLMLASQHLCKINGASGRGTVLLSYRKCSHMDIYAALSNAPRALADGLMLASQQPWETAA